MSLIIEVKTLLCNYIGLDPEIWVSRL